MFGDTIPAALIRVLGPVDAVLAGRSVSLSALERALLAALAARRGRTVSVEQLIGVLWPDTAPRSARNRVHALVSSIRRRMGHDGAVIVTSPPGYRLAGEGGTLDVVCFDELLLHGRQQRQAGQIAEAIRSYRRALALWRGTPFDGVDTVLDPALSVEAARLAEARRTAIEDCLDAELAAGRHGAVLPELTALVAENPLRERLRVQLMLALHRSGRAAEASAVYREGYEILAEQAGVGPGLQLQETHRLVLAGEAAPPPAGAALLVGLPTEVPDFVGRVNELAQLLGVLRSAGGAPTVVSISGLGGIGKTSLALHAAHRTETDRIFFDMRGTGSAPRSPAQVMRSVLDVLGTPATTIPADSDALAAVYRAALSTRRLLLLLDDAHDENQVRPLLAGGTGSALVVTSRRPLLGIDGAVQLPLNPLPVAEARVLLTNLVGRPRADAEPSQLDRILEHCGRLPLAVRLVGVRLAQQPELALARMVDRLADLDHRLDRLAAGDRRVRVTLHTAFMRLDPAAATAVRHIGLLPTAEFPAWALAAMTGADPADAVTALTGAVAASMVSPVYETGGPRFRVHDLVRAYAAERAAIDDGVDDANLARRRLYERLVGLAWYANDQLPTANIPLPPLDPAWGAGADCVLAPAGGAESWLWLENGLLVASVRDCVSRQWWDLAWPLTVSMAANASDRGDVEQWCDLAETVLAALPQGGHRLGWATVSLALGGILRGRGRTGESMPWLRNARRNYRLAGDPDAAAIAAAQLGMAYRALGRFRAAEAALRTALRDLDPVHAAQHVAQTEIGLGNLYLDDDRSEPAGAAYQRALVALARQPNPAIEANAWVCLGSLARHQHRWPDAADHYQRALRVLKGTGDRVTLAHAELGLGDTYLNLGDIERADQFIARASQATLDLGDVVGHAGALALQGRLSLATDDRITALELLTEAAARLRRMGHEVAAAQVQRHITIATR